MVERKQRISRAVRTARGALGALFTTLLAAASHALAGGTVTAFALLATALVALPLCVALSGRIGSPWRLGLAVTVSQFLYHWTFAGLGIGANSPTGPAGAHAGHMVDSFIPALGSTFANADLWMWISHAVTAVITVALLYRGEAATLRFARVLRCVLPRFTAPTSALLVQPPAPLVSHTVVPLRTRLTNLSAKSHRGPPFLIATQ